MMGELTAASSAKWLNRGNVFRLYAAIQTIVIVMAYGVSFDNVFSREGLVLQSVGKP